MEWQRQLGREAIYFILMVIISLLFWAALAVIIEQHIIAPEYLYTRERNGFILTIGVLYLIRLHGWLIDLRGPNGDHVCKTELQNGRKNAAMARHGAGEAKEQCGKIMDLAKPDWMADPFKQHVRDNGRPC